jgi:hypothetical protein
MFTADTWSNLGYSNKDLRHTLAFTFKTILRCITFLNRQKEKKRCQNVHILLHSWKWSIYIGWENVGPVWKSMFCHFLTLFNVQSECSMPSNFCYAVPHNLLKSPVLLFYQALGMEIQRYSNVSCALTDYEPFAGLIVYSLCKNIVTEYSHIQKWRCRIKHRIKGKRKKEMQGKTKEQRKKEWYFQARVYYGCCAGLHNNNWKALNIHMGQCIYFWVHRKYAILLKGMCISAENSETFSMWQGRRAVPLFPIDEVSFSKAVIF